jgi:hypothetical protein
MKILDRLPVLDKYHQSWFQGESVRIRPFQIVVPLSLSVIPIWDPRTPIIPALLDTGNNHNFSIQENHLARWVGAYARGLPLLGTLRESTRTATLRFANVWMHCNRPGQSDLREREPFLLHLEEGVAVYPYDGSNYPRLPLLGLRAIIKIDLKLVLDGKRRYVTLSSPIWCGCKGSRATMLGVLPTELWCSPRLPTARRSWPGSRGKSGRLSVRG